MARIDTLTAYKLQFNYMQRNNPLIDEQRDAIKAGKSPEYTFSNFVDDYTIIVANWQLAKIQIEPYCFLVRMYQNIK